MVTTTDIFTSFKYDSFVASFGLATLVFEPDGEPFDVIQFVLKQLVYELVGWLGSRSIRYAYLHFPFSNVGGFAHKILCHFIIVGLNQIHGYNFYVVLATMLLGLLGFWNLFFYMFDDGSIFLSYKYCSSQLSIHHVLENSINGFKERQKLVHDSNNTISVGFLWIASHVARVGLLYSNVNDDYQLHDSGQCLHSCIDDLYDNCVVLLEIISGSNHFGSPTLGLCEITFGKVEEKVDPLCHCYYFSEWTLIYFENVRSKPLGAAKFLLDQGRINMSYKLASSLKHEIAMSSHSKNWDPDGDDCSIHTNSSSQFKMWDPGGYFLVIRKIRLTWRSLEKMTIGIKCIVLTSTLRTRLIFNGGGIVMNLDNKLPRHT